MSHSAYSNALGRVEHLREQLQSARSAGRSADVKELKRLLAAEENVAAHAMKVLQLRREHRATERVTEVSFEMVQDMPLPSGETPRVIAAREALSKAERDLVELKANECRHPFPKVSDPDAMEGYQERRAFFYEDRYRLEQAIQDARIDLFMAPVLDAEEEFFKCMVAMGEAFYSTCLAAWSARKRLHRSETGNLREGLYSMPLPETLPTFTDFATDSASFRRWSELMEMRRTVMHTDGADGDLRNGLAFLPQEATPSRSERSKAARRRTAPRDLTTRDDDSRPRGAQEPTHAP